MLLEGFIFRHWFALVHPDIVIPPTKALAQLGEQARQQGAKKIDPDLFSALLKEARAMFPDLD